MFQPPTTVPTYECYGTDVSDDCQSEYDNAVRNGNMVDFYHRCTIDEGFRTKCALCCEGGVSTARTEGTTEDVLTLSPVTVTTTEDVNTPPPFTLTTTEVYST